MWQDNWHLRKQKSFKRSKEEGTSYTHKESSERSHNFDSIQCKSECEQSKNIHTKWQENAVEWVNIKAEK